MPPEAVPTDAGRKSNPFALDRLLQKHDASAPSQVRRNDMVLQTGERGRAAVRHAGQPHSVNAADDRALIECDDAILDAAGQWTPYHITSRNIASTTGSTLPYINFGEAREARRSLRFRFL